MRRLPLAATAARRPRTALALLATVSVVLGALATQQDTATDIAEFSTDGELAHAFDRVDDEFGARGDVVHVLVDAGRGGDVLDREGLVAAEEVAALVRDTLADRLAGGTPAAPAVATWADPVLVRLEALDLAAAELTDVFADAAVSAALADDPGQVGHLVSDDLDPDTGRARAGLVLVRLDGDLPTGERLEAARALEEALARADLGFLTASAFSVELLHDDVDAALDVELPRLLLVSLALMVVVLAVLYRRLGDVVVGLVGLGITILWMTGLSVLLGPDHLGVTGPFNQLAIAVPVLLVGLGIDYSVHLTTRYREDRGRGFAPALAATSALRTVGIALALATLTTLFGFLANVVAPLPPVRDFGVFAAAGVASAFVVLGTLVPAVRTLVDRRRPDRRAPPVAEGAGSAQAIRAAAAVARRAPAGVLTAALVVGVAGTVAAADLDTEFSREEFVPSGSDAARTLAHLDERFGGDVAEETFLLVDADFGRRDAWQALLEVEQRLATVDGVVTAGGRADVTSPTGLLAVRTELAASVAARLQARLASVTDEDGDAPGAPVVLPDRLAVDDLPEPLRDEVVADGLPSATGEDRVRDGLDLDGDGLLPPGADPAEAVVDRLFGRELASGLQAALDGDEVGHLDRVDPEQAADLVARDPAAVGLADLRDVGYPVERLPTSVRRLLSDVDALHAAGWTGTSLAADADVASLRAVLEGPGGDGLDGLLRSDAQAALVRVGTRAGEEGAEQLVADLGGRLAPLADVGAEVTVASEPLLVDETLTALGDAQTQAIVVSMAAALALLTAYYQVTRRRPLLGPITLLPALLAVPLVLGSMWLTGLPFNALTATIASIAIGIGVPYGIHLTNRYVEELDGDGDPDRAVATTLANTGAALVGSAVTTAVAFAVLLLSGFPPIRQFGGITALTIVYALVAALLVESAALTWWGRLEACRRRRDRDRTCREEARLRLGRGGREPARAVASHAIAAPAAAPDDVAASRRQP